ncbi:hypothetical protein FQR65_LT14173 [Abscondita terminalis]|nr:hypothetical protein FQR65_LT14173 [Abscondita terminalis]
MGEPEENQKVHLPDVQVEMPPRDLLRRLLEIDPTKRLRSVRVLQTILLYKGYNWEDVKTKKFSPKEMLEAHSYAKIVTT